MTTYSHRTHALPDCYGCDTALLDDTTTLRLLLISSDSDDNAARIATGRVLQRLLLRLSAANLACAFLNPPCEVAAIRAELRETLRIGYVALQPYSRRLSIDEVIMPTA